MENKTPSQNIQDVYLNTVRREKAPVTVFLISGVKLIGKIKGFDKYSVILEANNQERLIFKHAISTVTTAGWHRRRRRRHLYLSRPPRRSRNNGKRDLVGSHALDELRELAVSAGARVIDEVIPAPRSSGSCYLYRQRQS